MLEQYGGSVKLLGEIERGCQKITNGYVKFAGV